MLDASCKWYNLGLELKINPDSLDAIQKENRGNVQDCLRDLLKQWLRRGEPKATWGTLIEALKSPLVGEEHLSSTLPIS